MAAPLSRNSQHELIEQNFTDPLNEQNTAATSREVLHALVDSARNVVDDDGGATGGGDGGKLYATPGINTDGAMTQKATTEYVRSRATNMVIGGPKSALYLNRADAVAAGHPDDLALEDIADSVIVIGNDGYVDLPATGQVHRYVTRYYGGPNPTRFCFMDGDGVPRPDHFQQYGGLAPYAWFPVDSAAAGVPAYASLPGGYPFKVDELVRDYAGTDSELFFASLNNGPLPAPSAANGDANWRRVAEADIPTGSTVRLAMPVTYAQLTALIAASKLDPGNSYLLTDYQLTHTIAGTSTTFTGPIEPLYLTAAGANRIAAVAYSQTYPQDIVYYSVNNTGYMPGATRGYIYRRIDTDYGNDLEIDFRTVRFRRWYETFAKADYSGLSGGFTSLVNNGNAFQDFQMFGYYFKCRNNVWSGFERTRLGTNDNVSIFDNVNFVSHPDEDSRVLNSRLVNAKIFGTVQGGTWFREVTMIRSELRNFKGIRYQFRNFFGGTLQDSILTNKVVDGEETAFTVIHSQLTNEPLAGRVYIDSKLYGANSGATIATTAYALPTAGPQTITQAGATWFGDVGIGTDGGEVVPLQYATGYTFSAGQLQLLKNVAAQAVIVYSYATGPVSGPGGAAYDGDGITIAKSVGNVFSVIGPRTALLNGNTVKFDFDGVYPAISSGTFLVDTAGAVKGKVATITVAAGGSAPDLSNSLLVKISGTHTAAKNNLYAFLVDGNGSILYKISSY